MTTISVIIASYGERRWEILAQRRPFPTAVGFHEVILKHEPDATLAEVRNAGAAEANGEYLLFVDADDSLAPGFADAMQAALAEQGPGEYLLTPAIQYGADKRFSAPSFWPEIDIRTGNWMVVGTLIPRHIFESIGGWAEYEWSEDWDLWARAMKAGALPVKVPEASYVVHVSANSRNRRPMNERRYWMQVMGHANWPDYYDAPTDEENSTRTLHTKEVRRG